MWKPIRRLAPALAVLTLLGAAAMGANAPSPQAVPDALVYPNCAITLQRSGSSTTYLAPVNSNLWQPIAGTGNVAACSLYVKAGYNGGSLFVEGWDPGALAPDPTSVALRSHAFQLSQFCYGDERVDFVPPIVTRAVPGVADPPRATLALHVSVKNLTAIVYSANVAPPPTPQAYVDTGGTLTPLQGANGAAAHWVCGGDAALQGLYVTQAVSRTDTALDSVECYVQRFRVPVRTQVSFVDLAFGPVDTRFPAVGGLCAIFDAADTPVPPTYLPPTLAQGVFSYPNYAPTALPAWGSHADFTTVPILEADHDYGLWVETHGFWRMYTRTLTGAEGAAFTAGIGPLYRRGDYQPFTPDPARALSFKLVGQPTVAVDAGARPVALAPLSLRATPNPAFGPARVHWSGARGAVRFEVIDTRGRRVAAGEAEGATGDWTWPATAADGRAVPAGIYFVRARDVTGATASERVVVLR